MPVQPLSPAVFPRLSGKFRIPLRASMAAMGLTGCGSDNVDGTKTAVTVNDESITLGQANFMLRYQQATMYNFYSKMYSMYGMQMPSEMYDKEGEYFTPV